MRRLLTEAVRFGDLSGGRFDVTVQPLWRFLAAHQAAAHSTAAVRIFRLHWHWSIIIAIDIASRCIRLGQPGMAITLNGIAQGYVTDRVAELLRARGVEHVLLDLGELRALGSKPNGQPWRIGVRDPAHTDHLLREFDVIDRAVATSAATAELNILDPRAGEGCALYSSVTVVTQTAAVADALSTILFLTPPEEVEAQVAKAGPAAVLLAGFKGTRIVENGWTFPPIRREPCPRAVRLFRSPSGLTDAAIIRKFGCDGLAFGLIGPWPGRRTGSPGLRSLFDPEPPSHLPQRVAVLLDGDQSW